MSLASRFSSLSLLFVSAASYTWPNPQLDELESMSYDQHGFNSRGLITDAVTPCSTFNFGDTANRSNAADWIRAAYHDMATFNIVDGTGGLDASIQYEQDRPENAGDALFNTIRHLALGISRYAGVADLIAVGAKTAIEQCGGPKVAFRGGRVDATGPNNPGVPQPQEDLDTHIAEFARQGFNQTEMIALVACGHSFGGVQNSAFPQTVPLPSGLADFDQTFDSTPFTFDNDVALEYIDNTTKSPLVVGQNDTTNSDKRIFGSDGNATMSAFADDFDLYKSTRGSLFARMLDTVPADVQLTEVINPLPVKPQSVQLKYMGDGTLQLSGQTRFWDMEENDARSISVHWEDRSGANDSSYTGVLDTNSEMVGWALNDGNYSIVWYDIGSLSENFTVVDEATGISNFWFVVDEGDGSSARTEDQNGAGFAIQDAVMIANSSCKVSDASTTTARIDIAVRNDATPDRVYLEYDIVSANAAGGTIIVVHTTDAQVVDSAQSTSSYKLWTVDLPITALSSSISLAVNIAADIGDEKVTTSSFLPFEILASTPCS